MLFLTADTHFSHAKVIKMCNRPYSSVEEMDESLIDNWNKTVSKKDIVYHCGDFAFRNTEYYVKRLNGQIHLILGNHDKVNLASQKYFKSISQIKIVNTKPKIVLCHYAMRRWPALHYDAWHLYGHSHGRLKEEFLSFDVGVDCWNYKPVSYDQVCEKMQKKLVDRFTERIITHNM